MNLAAIGQGRPVELVDSSAKGLSLAEALKPKEPVADKGNVKNSDFDGYDLIKADK